MSRDKGGNGIQEVVGSIPISSTNSCNREAYSSRKSSATLESAIAEIFCVSGNVSVPA